jgi:hypothetical protein
MHANAPCAMHAIMRPTTHRRTFRKKSNKIKINIKKKKERKKKKKKERKARQERTLSPNPVSGLPLLLSFLFDAGSSCSRGGFSLSCCRALRASSVLEPAALDIGRAVYSLVSRSHQSQSSAGATAMVAQTETNTYARSGRVPPQQK